ncbi:hypothetical protein [[Phormidium] sp. LEGE 05292]|uniref:hypothetical protein n=1 Tax=[Phormidium] sp. LEGE 05292 TaxID=767427 RepID=UPI001D15B5E2|nr:hypothetical protein [Phormidium sp. LEGE 05292]
MLHNSLHKNPTKSPLIHGVHLQASKSKLAILINKICERFVTLINHASELKVWQSRDRTGHTWWEAYDPSTGNSISLDSEAEMRMWIEERYH